LSREITEFCRFLGPNADRIALELCSTSWPLKNPGADDQFSFSPQAGWYLPLITEWNNGMMA
jgi:hypothetical protein